jgi:dihydroorotate dehydrogenase (fumarate)
VERELVTWAVESGFDSVAQLRGSVSQRDVADPSAFDRANYMAALTGISRPFH